MLVVQGLLDGRLHLHCTDFNRLSGVASILVIIGVQYVHTDPPSFRPHCL